MAIEFPWVDLFDRNSEDKNVFLIVLKIKASQQQIVNSKNSQKWKVAK